MTADQAARAGASDSWPAAVPPAAAMHAVVLPEFGQPDVLREAVVPTRPRLQVR
jgi:hypothetical protein